LSLVELTCSSIKSVYFFISPSSLCIDDIFSTQAITEILHTEVKLLYSALLNDIELARILFNEIATNKASIVDTNKDNEDNLLYF
jgi:hypothetical protein